MEADECNQEQSALQASVEEDSLQASGKEVVKSNENPMSYMDFLANPLRTDHPFGKINSFNLNFCRNLES